MTTATPTHVTQESYPGPRDYRRMFPASATLENIHRLVHSDGSTHLRNPFHRFGSHGPDASICSDTYRAPEGSTYDLTKKGRAAVAAVDCAACKRLIAKTVKDADAELPQIEREAIDLAASARSFRAIQAALATDVSDWERERVGAQVRGRESTLTLLEAFKR